LAEQLEKKRLQIGTAAELFARLRGPDPEIELVLLEAVAQRPEAALALCGEGESTLEEVVGECLDRAVPGADREAAAVRALAALPGPGPALRLWPRFATAPDWAVLNTIAQALGRLPLEWRRENLRQWLRGPAEPRSQLAANCLADDPTPAVQVRTDREDLPAPTFTPEWLEEFRGPYRDRAHLLWREHPELLAPHFEQLATATQRWLLTRLQGDPQWMLPDADPTVLSLLIERFDPPAWAAQHPHPQVRQAAARRLGNPESWRAESEPAVQATLVERLQDVDQLGQALTSPHWMVRAAASRAAARLGGEPMRDRIRELLSAATDPQVEAACAQTLVWLEDLDWLSSRLL
jgi:hypothetical protein